MERRGDKATGWSMAWKVNVWPRLRDGNHALKLITNLFTLVREDDKYSTGGLYPNIFYAQAPFQIDGNFGAIAGIAEMHVISHGGGLYLLPALPDAWSSGKVKGLKARGGFEIDMEQKKCKLKTAIIHSKLGGDCRVSTGNGIDLQNGKYRSAEGKNSNPFFKNIDPSKPLIKDHTKLMETYNKKSYSIDFQTFAEDSYTIK